MAGLRSVQVIGRLALSLELLITTPALVPSAQAAEEQPAAASASTTRQKQLAKHLQSQGFLVYGAWWCPHCNTQKELFGVEAMELLPYVECDKEEEGRKRCMAAKVRAYPTWDYKEERREGVMTLEELEVWSGFQGS
ncbi:hypothetical protein [Synechococcus sp. W4D4]|uniref:hypothetical protein n=1 Tax=Synechococcus sp. W4D4 TaxID=3392294 RepID=UPI0039EADB34